MVSQLGTMADESGWISDESAPDSSRDLLLWGVGAFALGMLCAWLGAFAWIVVTFLTT